MAVCANANARTAAARELRFFFTHWLHTDRVEGLRREKKFIELHAIWARFGPGARDMGTRDLGAALREIDWAQLQLIRVHSRSVNLR